MNGGIVRLGVERYHFPLRRLHSLTGIIPVGAFLFEHLLTNFGVVVGGQAKFDREVGLIHKLPWLVLVEWVFIFLPLAFHGLYGFFIASTGRSNVLYYRYGGNVRYTLQRITAILAAVFVVVHLLRFRFNYLLPGGQPFAAESAFDVTAAKFTGKYANWVFGFYVVGIVSAVYHFANGLWTALITWGVTLGPRSQRRAGWLCAIVGAALGLMGLFSLIWFRFGLASLPV